MPRVPKKERQLREFVTMLRADGLCEHTVGRYHRYNRDWLAWLAARRCSGEQATSEQAAEWFAYYRGRYSSSTQGQVLTAIIRYYKWLSSRNIAHQSPFAAIKRPNVTHKPTLSLSRQQTILAVGEFPCRTFRDLRDKSMVMLLYDCAIRVGTLQGVNYEDVNWQQRYIEIRKAKGNKSGIVWFHEQTASVVDCYLSVAEEDYEYTRTGPLFPGCRKNPRLDRGTIGSALTRILEYVDIEGRYTTRSMRKSRATHVYEETGDIHAAQRLLWHENIRTTERHYIADNPQLLKSKVMQHHAFDELPPHDKAAGQ